MQIDIDGVDRANIHCIGNTACLHLEAMFEGISSANNTNTFISCYTENACTGLHILADGPYTQLNMYAYSKDVILDNGWGFISDLNTITCGLDQKYIKYEFKDDIKELVEAEYDESYTMPCSDVTVICYLNQTTVPDDEEKCEMVYIYEKIKHRYDVPCIYAALYDVVKMVCEGNCISSPTLTPTSAPSLSPSKAPTGAPSESPSRNPTTAPTFSPSQAPFAAPSLAPSLSPSTVPSYAPSSNPSKYPTASPSQAPSVAPTFPPSTNPTTAPSFAPSTSPSQAPTAAPSFSPSNAPSMAPSTAPSFSPSLAPSIAPTSPPTSAPSIAPTFTPTLLPTVSPTRFPTSSNEYDSFIDIVYGIEGLQPTLIDDLITFLHNFVGMIEDGSICRSDSIIVISLVLC